MQKLNSSLFTWSRWRAGSLADFGIVSRKTFILANRKTLKRFGVGFCDGGAVPCRPKSGKVAVMFFVNGKHFWNHLNKDEFEDIWGRYEP